MRYNLTSYIKLPEVRQALSSIQPNMKRTIKADSLVPRVSDRYYLVGIAFDYLLRVKIKKEVPSSQLNLLALPRNFLLPVLYWKKEDCLKYGWLTDDVIGSIPVVDENDNEYLVDGEKVKNSIEGIQTKVSYIIEAYTGGNAPLDQVAWACCRLALLEELQRPSLDFKPDFEAANLHQEEAELLDLLRVVPETLYKTEGDVILNPTLGFTNSDGSGIGGDADILNGNHLIDVKTVTKCVASIEILNQLLGYFLLARSKKRINAEFPDIGTVSIYFSRHGYLWSMDTSEWLDNKDFSRVEKLFLSRYKKA